MQYQWDWGTLFTPASLTSLQVGLEYTLLVSALSLVAGTILGVATAIVRLWGPRPVALFVKIYVEFFRTTPILVQLIWVFYVLPVLLGIDLDAVTSGVIALSLNSGAFLSEIFRGGLVSISRSQHDAAQVLGLTRAQSLRYVIVPQAARRVLPSVANSFISLIKDSSLLAFIAVSELTYQATIAVSTTYRPLEIYTGLAVVYFLLTYPLALGTSALERRFRVT